MFRLDESIQNQLIQAVKANDVDTINFLLATATDSLDLLFFPNATTSLIHIAAMHGSKEAFDALLIHAYKKSPENFNELLNKLATNGNQQRSPWHWAAEYGFAKFFERIKITSEANKELAPGLSSYDLQNHLITAWLNVGDINGDAPLHLAMMYHDEASTEVIKNKKHTVTAIARLRTINLNKQNNANLTPLAKAIQAGKFFTSNALVVVNVDYREKKSAYNQRQEQTLKIPQKKDDSMGSKHAPVVPEAKDDIEEKKTFPKLINLQAMQNVDTKRLLIRQLLNYHSTTLKDDRGREDQKKIDKNKIDSSSSTNNNNTPEPKGSSSVVNADEADPKSSSKENIFSAVDNSNMSEEEFLTELKKFNALQANDARRAIAIYIAALKERNFRRNLLTAAFGAICPAITVAAVAGTAGGINSEPFLATALTGASLIIVYIPFVWSCYQEKVKEYNTVVAETLYLKWLRTRIQDYENKIRNELKAIIDALNALSDRLEKAKAEDIPNLNLEYTLLKQHYERWKTQVNEAGIISLPDDTHDISKKPKLVLHYLDKEEFDKRKHLAANDPKEKADWATRKDRVAAGLSHSLDTWCPTGALLAIGGTVSSFLFSKAGLGLGLGILSFLAGPIGIAVATIVATLVLAAIVGGILYKSSFNNEKGERGSKNKELVFSHYECKMRCKNLEKLKSSVRKVQNGFRKVGDQLNNLEHPPAAQPDPMLSPEPMQRSVPSVESSLDGALSATSRFKHK